MAKIGSLIVELGLDDKVSSRQLSLITAELNNFQSKLDKLNMGQLSAMATQLDNKLASTQKSISNTAKKISDLKAELNTTKGSKDTDLISFNTGQISMLEQQMKRLSNEESMIIAKTSMVADGLEAFGGVSGPDQLGKKLGEIGEALNDESEDILDNLNKIEDKIDEVGNKTTGSGEKITKGFSKGLKSLKLFSLGLMGLRSMMSLLTSSANTYIQSNDTLSAKLEGAKQGLAQALAPAIELAVSLFVKLVHWVLLAINYIGIFISTLLGVRWNIVGASKDMKNLTKSTKSANKELSALAGFDELNILSTDSGGGAGAGAVAPDFTGVGLSEEDLAGLNKFQEWLEINKEPVKLMTLLIGGLALAFVLLGSPLALILIALGLFAYLIYEVVKNWDNMSNAEKVLSVLGIAILAIIALVLIFNASLLANPLTWIILAVIVAIGLLVAAFFVIKDNWTAIVDWFVNTFKSIGNWFKNIGKSIGDFFAGIWNGIKSGIDKAIGFITGMINGIKTVFSNVWNFILGLLGKGGQIFSGIVDGIANIMKGVINAIIGGLNFIIKQPLEFINGVLNFIRNISFLGISPFKGLWKQNPIPIPQIPKLATGSSLTEETLFIGGEYPGAKSNPEIVSPKSDIKEANKEAIAEMGGAGGRQPIKAEIVVNIGGKEAGRKIIDIINETQEDAGKTLLKI